MARRNAATRTGPGRQCTGCCCLAGPHPPSSSYVLNPRGRILAVARKVYPTAQELGIGIRRGDGRELEVAQTEIGRVAILICLDGFYESLVSRLDSQGAQLVIQPSANPVPWQAVWKGGRWVAPDPARALRGITQEE